MNTEMMDRFEVLDADRLASVEGGGGPIFGKIAGGYVLGKVFDGIGSDATKSCQKNPKQWFCVPM